MKNEKKSKNEEHKKRPTPDLKGVKDFKKKIFSRLKKLRRIWKNLKRPYPFRTPSGPVKKSRTRKNEKNLASSNFRIL